MPRPLRVPAAGKMAARRTICNERGAKRGPPARVGAAASSAGRAGEGLRLSASRGYQVWNRKPPELRRLPHAELSDRGGTRILPWSLLEGQGMRLASSRVVLRVGGAETKLSNQGDIRLT